MKSAQNLPEYVFPLLINKYFKVKTFKKFHWKMATPIYLCVVFGCCSTTVAEWDSLDSCSRDHMAHKVKNNCLALCRKTLPASGLCQ